MNDGARARIEEICLAQIAIAERSIERMERGDKTTYEIKNGQKVDTTENEKVECYQRIEDLKRTLETLKNPDRFG